jgi:succinyl-diaminopimelate desuccinylase
VARSADQAAKAQAWIAERADEMAELLIRLVACETENPPGRNLAECAGILRAAMARLGLAPEILAIGPAGTAEQPCAVRGACGAADADRQGRLVYFHGHFDVVPVQDRVQFTARRGNGTITGRGTADMKGGIVSMLYGAAAARDLGLLGDGRVVIHLVCDEETGSEGSGYLGEHGLIDPRALAMLTAEQSGGVIWNAAKGALSLRVEVHGRPAHVGQAARGVNSFLHMLKVAAPMEAYAREMSHRHTRHPVGDGQAAGSMVVVGGKSGGGSNFNVVPARTWFTIDGRFNPEEDLDAELARLTAAINDAAAAAGAEVAIEVTQFAPAVDTPSGSHPARVLGGCVADVTGAPARFELCPGCLDTRWYAQQGIPAFGFGPGRFDVSHGPDEYVAEAGLHRAAAVYALFAGRLLG